MQPQQVNHLYQVNPNDPYYQRERYDHKHDVAARATLLLGGAIVSLLLVRFVFALLAANQSNGIAEFVFSFTSPFVTPFVGLFHFDHATIGNSSFEVYALVAAITYGALSSTVAKLITITRY